MNLLEHHRSTNPVEGWLDNQIKIDRRIGITRREKLLRRVAGPLATVAALGTVLFVATEQTEQGPQPYNLNQTHREYTAQRGDSIFDIAERAEPNQDPRNVSDNIIETIEMRDHVGREQAEVLRPGEAVPLPADAVIGTLVEVA